jgi:hypothetical protein
MRVLLDLPIFAPIPVGHHVSVVPLESCASLLALLGATRAPEWRPIADVVLCDEDTHVLYAARGVGLHPEATYEHIAFEGQTMRVSLSQPLRRGRVVSCTALSDRGERVFFQTLLGVELAP